ncbi:MAG: PEP-CTERM sorting domain-containing protein [Bryobacteraceae bacterium]
MSSHLGAAPVFSVVNTGNPGAAISRATGVNAYGETAGTSRLASGDAQGYSHDGGSASPLGTSTDANGINTAGQIAGTSYAEGNAEATVWSGGYASGLGTLGGQESYATGINDAGAVVGGAHLENGEMRAFRYSDGSMLSLGVLGAGIWSAAYGINNQGQVTGYSMDAHGRSTAFLWDVNTGMRSLGTLGGTSSHGMGISSSGMVVGASTSYSGFHHAFLHNGSNMMDLGTLGGLCSFAYGINSAGDVVGYSQVAGSTESHAFLWIDGVMYDLNLSLSDNSGWVLEAAYGINDAGQIVGSGKYRGITTAFRLDPLVQVSSQSSIHTGDVPLVENPEPGTLSLLVLAAAAALIAGWLRRRQNGQITSNSIQAGRVPDSGYTV